LGRFDMSGTKHILILGGGVIGLSAAYYCARRGFAVTVVDRNPEQRDGCSFGNAGMVVPSHFIPLAAPGMVDLGLKWMWNPESPFWIKPRLDLDLMNWGYLFWRACSPEHVARSAPLLRDLSLASRNEFEELAALPDNDFGLVKKGLLMLCKTQHGLDDEARAGERARELGIPAEVLDAKQTAALDPGATLDVAGSVFFPKDCHLTPGRFMAGLKQQAEKLGVKFVWNREVAEFRLERDRSLCAAQLSDGTEIEADEFVLAGGSWSPTVAAKLALELPMQAGKGYSLTLPNPRQLPQLCTILTEARVAVTPMGSSLRVGGTMEIAGLNEDINPVRVRGIVKALPKYYPAFRAEDFEGIQPWRGLRPCSPDGLPYVGRTAKFANLTLATGHAMMGLSLAPITGKLVGQILANEKPALDLGLLSPDRFA
jgi:D-amino-acid dehydrogenase